MCRPFDNILTVVVQVADGKASLDTAATANEKVTLCWKGGECVSERRDGEIMECGGDANY